MRVLRITCWLLAAALLWGCSGSGATAPATGIATPTPAASENLVSVPGTHVSLVPPQGFSAATAFTGFQSASGASILVMEFPADYEELAAGITDDAMAGQAVSVSSRKTVTIDGRESLWLEGTQEANGGTYGKIILLTGTDSLSAMLTGNYDASDEATGESIRAALVTVTFRPEMASDPQAGLSFTISPKHPLKFAGAMGGAGLYNTSGQIPSADKDEPSFTVARSLTELSTLDREAFLDTFPEQRLRALPTTKNPSVESRSRTNVAGMAGVELIATADRYNRPGRVMVVEYVLVSDSGYILMVGICPIEQREDFLPVFRDTAQTLQLKP